jgi:hypothetical protein
MILTIVVAVIGTDMERLRKKIGFVVGVVGVGIDLD